MFVAFTTEQANTYINTAIRNRKQYYSEKQCSVTAGAFARWGGVAKLMASFALACSSNVVASAMSITDCKVPLQGLRLEKC